MENKNYNILIVEKNKINAELIGNSLKKFGLVCDFAGNYSELDIALEKIEFYHLVLIDIAGFDTEIWERCIKIHNLGIPFLILSAKPSAALQEQGIRVGASGIIIKPVVLKEFVRLIYATIGAEQ